VKHDGVSENYVRQIFIDQLKRQGAALQKKGVRWMIGEMADIKAEDGIEKRQRVKLKLELGASYVYEAEFMIYDIKGFDSVPPKIWMHDINRRYQIDNDSHEMWIADNLWGERDDGRVHYLPGLCPLDVDNGIVKQAKFMGINIVPMAAYENVSTRPLKWAVLIRVLYRGDGDTLLTEPPGEFQAMLTEWQGLLASQLRQIRRMEGRPISKLQWTRMAKYCSSHHTASLHVNKKSLGCR
jgi:hypothetical protein